MKGENAAIVQRETARVAGLAQKTARKPAKVRLLFEPEASRGDNSLTIGKCAYHGQISRRPVKAMALILHSFSDDELTSSHFVHDWQLLFR